MELTRDILLYLVIAVCAITDVMYGKIFNKITYPAIILGLLINLLLGKQAFQSSVIGMLVAFILFLIVFMIGGLGGGDVKLMTAIGAIKGYPFVMYAAFYSALVGGLMSIAIMIWKGRFLKGMRNIFRVIFSYIFSFIFPGVKPLSLSPEESEKIPFGFAICLGTLWAVLEFMLNISVFDYFKI